MAISERQRVIAQIPTQTSTTISATFSSIPLTTSTLVALLNGSPTLGVITGWSQLFPGGNTGWDDPATYIRAVQLGDTTVSFSFPVSGNWDTELLLIEIQGAGASPIITYSGDAGATTASSITPNNSLPAPANSYAITLFGLFVPNYVAPPAIGTDSFDNGWIYDSSAASNISNGYASYFVCGHKSFSAAGTATTNLTTPTYTYNQVNSANTIVIAPGSGTNYPSSVSASSISIPSTSRSISKSISISSTSTISLNRKISKNLSRSSPSTSILSTGTTHSYSKTLLVTSTNTITKAFRLSRTLNLSSTSTVNFNKISKVSYLISMSSNSTLYSGHSVALNYLPSTSLVPMISGSKSGATVSLVLDNYANRTSLYIYNSTATISNGYIARIDIDGSFHALNGGNTGINKFSINIGDGTTSVFTITHNLNTVDVIAQLRDSLGNNVIMNNWQAYTNNSIIITFTSAPTVNQYRLTVIG